MTRKRMTRIIQDDASVGARALSSCMLVAITILMVLGMIAWVYLTRGG